MSMKLCVCCDKLRARSLVEYTAIGWMCTRCLFKRVPHYLYDKNELAVRYFNLKHKEFRIRSNWNRTKLCGE